MPTLADNGGGITPRAQQWRIIDLLEEGKATPALLVSAYTQLSVIYSSCDDLHGAKFALQNAAMLRSAAIGEDAKDLEHVVFQFCIDAAEQGAEVDKETLAIAAARLQELKKMLPTGLTPLPTPREFQWSIIEGLEGRNNDEIGGVDGDGNMEDKAAREKSKELHTMELVKAYEQLAAACVRCGDAYGAQQAREHARILPLSPIELQLSVIDAMEEGELINPEQLSRAYMELSKLYTQQGDDTWAKEAERDSRMLQEILSTYVVSGRGGEEEEGGGGGCGSISGTPRSEWKNKQAMAKGKWGQEGEEEEHREWMERENKGGWSPESSLGGEMEESIGGKFLARQMTQQEREQQRYRAGTGAGLFASQEKGHHAYPGSALEGSLTLGEGSIVSEGSLGGALGEQAGSVGTMGVDGTAGASGSTGRHRKSAFVAALPNLNDAKYGRNLSPQPVVGGPQINRFALQNQKLQASLDSSQSLLSIDSAGTIQNIVTIDCTNRAMHALEDALVKVKIKLVYLRAEFTAVEKLKGRCDITLTYSTGSVELAYKWAYLLKFKVFHDGKYYYGKLGLTHMTKSNVFDESRPYPQEIFWKDGISPTGTDYNQVVAVLQSGKGRNLFRDAYKQFEDVVIQDYMPRFQQQRSGAAYKNLEGKKAAVYDMKVVAQVLQDSILSTSDADGDGEGSMTIGASMSRGQSREITPPRNASASGGANSSSRSIHK